MTNYQLGKIYKIVCNTTGLTYYGSTCEPTLARRLAGHVSKYKNFISNEKGHFITSFKVLENDNYTIILVELAPSNDKMGLLQRERYYIENNECVNKQIPIMTRKEIQIKFLSVEINRLRMIERNRTWYQNNKDKEKFKEKVKERLLKNKETISETRAEWYSKNKDKINETSRVKHICECGNSYTHSNRAVHCKTKIHTNFVNSQLDLIPPLGLTTVL